MTGQVQAWVESCVARFPLSGDVLEVGSYDVCGNPRHHFTAEPTRFPSYIGIDQADGPNVDQVMLASQLRFPDQTFGVVVSCEMIEHDPTFWVSIREMARVLRPGGHLLLTTRSWRGCPPHGEPYGDYWRFLPAGLQTLLESNGMLCLETVDSVADFGTFAIGHRED